MQNLRYLVTGFLVVLIVVGGSYALTHFGNQLIKRLSTSPSPSPSATATADLTASPLPSASVSPSSTPKPSYTPAKTYTPKATGTVKGTSTTSFTTTSLDHLRLELVKTSACQTYTTQISDIQGSLTLKYTLKDGYSANVTAWKSNGEEVIPQTTISGSGTLKTVSGLDYLKVQTQPASCSSTSDIWLTLTAER